MSLFTFQGAGAADFLRSASSGVKTNLTQVQNLGNLWNSSTLQSVYANLTMNTTSANSGNLTGNRVFYSNDYAVSGLFHSHLRDSFLTRTLRGY